jgi:hypothetical protein
LSRIPLFLQTIPAIAHAQTATIIPANEAASHVNEWPTVEGVVAKVFTSKEGTPSFFTGELIEKTVALRSAAGGPQ